MTRSKPISVTKLQALLPLTSELLQDWNLRSSIKAAAEEARDVRERRVRGESLRSLAGSTGKSRYHIKKILQTRETLAEFVESVICR